ncbi:MAG: AI-2E family transporter [Candidatus Woesearchaeota archaeon]
MKPDIKRYLFLGIFLILVIASYLIIRPFLTALLTSIILAYIFYPFYVSVFNKIKNKGVSSFLVCIMIFMIISLPILFLINSLTTGIQYVSSIESSLQADVLEEHCLGKESVLCSFFGMYSKVINHDFVRGSINQILSDLKNSMFNATKDVLFNVPTILLNIFVMFFVLYYLLKDGDKFIIALKKLLPVSDKDQNIIISKFEEVTYAVVYGNILVALIQGFVALIGFWIFGFKSFLILGALTAIAALIPFIGTAIIWVPVSVFKIFSGLIEGGTLTTTQGMLMFAWGLFLVAGIDNIVRPWIIGNKTNLHPILILIGLLGGIVLFGFIGIIIGPIILSILVIFIDIFKKKHIKF